MAKLTFEEYCEDFLDMHTGLASEAELASARKGYEIVMAPAEKKVVIKETVSQLKAELARLAAMQERSIGFAEKKGLDTTPLSQFVSFAKETLNRKAKKVELVAAIEASKQASRDMNAQGVK